MFLQPHKKTSEGRGGGGGGGGRRGTRRKLVKFEGGRGGGRRGGLGGRRRGGGRRGETTLYKEDKIRGRRGGGGGGERRRRLQEEGEGGRRGGGMTSGITRRLDTTRGGGGGGGGGGRGGGGNLPSSLRCLVLLLFCAVLTEASSFPQSDVNSKVFGFNDLLPENPRDYDKMRPPKKQGRPTNVYFHVTVMGIDSINENSMTYVADIFFAQSWKDHRLRLPENLNSSYRLLEVEWLKNMWRPDSFFKNAKQVTFQTMTIPNHYVWLHKDSTILYMVKLTLTLSCAMNYAIYPHDTQECRMQMESLSHTTEDLVFDWEPDVPLVVDDNIELPQFDLVGNHTADCTQVYHTGNFTCLEVVFQLRRRLGYYLFHTYMPTCLIVIMSWVSFWIKPEAAPARVTLGVTSLLTLSTQHAKSQDSLPPVSYIKIIDMFMSTCTVFVFLALMEYALVNIVLGDGPEVPPKNKDKHGKAGSLQTCKKENGRLAISALPTGSLFPPDPLGDFEGGPAFPQHTPITPLLSDPLPPPPFPQPSTIHHPLPPLHPHTHHHPHPHPRPPHLHHDPPLHPQLHHHHHHHHHFPGPHIRLPPPAPGFGDMVCPPLPNVPPPPPPPQRHPGPTPAMKRRAKAILVDRFSRVFFPSTFGLINGVYWIIFWLYL
ncbi:glycine receptor subunit alpha-4-like [Eriocheir sinensis]|uniref:glycine receptor subunit alpha-4-like n=1 Tax=Eriocheir sinensis TaxID=95602 RepID=UPI0021C98AEF|nr:glycine receptor subunit alpha-4-like [Eriocheir sinensis]